MVSLRLTIVGDGEMSLTNDVLDALSSEGQTRREIAGCLFAADEAVTKALSHLKRKGKAIMIRNGKEFLWMANNTETRNKLAAAAKNWLIDKEELDSAVESLVAISRILHDNRFDRSSVVDGVRDVCDLSRERGKQLSTLMQEHGIALANLDKFNVPLTSDSLAKTVTSLCIEISQLKARVNAQNGELERKPLTKLELAQAIIDAGMYPSELSDLCEALEVIKAAGYNVEEA